MNRLLRWLVSTLALIAVTFTLTRLLPTEPGPQMNGWDWVSILAGILVYSLCLYFLPKGKAKP